MGSVREGLERGKLPRQEQFAAGRRRMAIGAGWFFVGAALTGISLVWFPRTQSYLVALIGMAWGGFISVRGYLQARSVATGKLLDGLRKSARLLLIGSVGTLVLGYWTWHLKLYQRSKLIAQWEIESRVLYAFDSLETRLFEELDGSLTAEAFLAAWDRYSPPLARYRRPLGELLETGRRIDGFLTNEKDKRSMQADLRIVALYHRETRIYREIQGLVADRRPGIWPEGLQEKIEELDDLITTIRESTDSRVDLHHRIGRLWREISGTGRSQAA